MTRNHAVRLAAAVERLLRAPLPLRLRLWDGSEAGPTGAPVLVIRHRRALRRLLFRPGELGLARAWVAGEIDVEGDLFEALDLLAPLVWAGDPAIRRPSLREASVRSALATLVGLAGPLPPPPPPAEEIRHRRGRAHSKSRDRRVIGHHYDVGNEFHRLLLGPSMVYSCAYWSTPDTGLDRAQHDKLDLVCRKLDLRPGRRLLDVGCGWGSLALHAARAHGARVVGVTLSREQAELAGKRVAEAGLAHRVEIRLQDYRDVTDGPYDAISSIGMAEHVGTVEYRRYAELLYGLLRPGGRLLNHQIARRPLADESRYRIDRFIDAYVFPDGELAPLGATTGLLEAAGFEVRDVEALREHYVLTLRAWVRNLEADRDRAATLTTPGRVRVWHLYTAASALAFAHDHIGVHQILATRTPDDGASGLALRPRAWTGDPGRP
ncbi:class I SAM-dependent methyltransferase (plasmid) [Streptomyces sp. BI20]|uniref:class I SAM-dependent methyltransferase n=1 Tax=Streptomyces sp. BI20 TaxID=3403460 RepID=UPI003C76A7C8